MSTVQPQHLVVAEPAAGPGPAVGASPAGVPVGEPRLFRGRTLEALLPQIRAALGPDAIVLRRREGLSGGVGGFFQQRFVEVEAVAGQPAGFDAYDDAPAWPEDVSADGVRWLDEGAAPAALPAAPPAAVEPSVVPFLPAPEVAVAPSASGSPAAGAGAPSAAAPFLAAAAAGTPIDGTAFLRHLDEAVERRNALAPGATDEAFEAVAPARGLLRGDAPSPVVAREAAAPPAVGPDAPAAPSGRGTVAAYARAGVVADVPGAPTARESAPVAAAPAAPAAAATPVRATFPRIVPSAPAGAAAPAPVAVADAVADLAVAAAPVAAAPVSAAPPVAAAPAATAAPVDAAPAALEPSRPAPALGRRTTLPAPLASTDLASAVAVAPVVGAGAVAVASGPVARTAAAASRPGGETGGAAPSSERPSRASREAAPRSAARRPDIEVAVPERSTVDADVAEYGLIARGLSPAVARSVVLEAAAHGQPLDAGHRIDRATRAALARRIPQTAPRGGVRTMVIVGAPGAGRTSAVGALAAAHARAGRRVLAVAMDAPDGGAALAATLVGTDAELLVATGGATAAAAIRVARPDVCVVDTPAVHPSDHAAVEALAAELRALGADEVHLALPGTDQTTAALGALDGLEPLRPDALLMTHRDRAERPGGVVGASIVRGLPIAYVTDGRAVALAEPARLARMVQP